MPYSAQISRTNPACILLLIDQSKSIDEPFVGIFDQNKTGVVADAVNRLLQNIVLRSAKADGVRDYFHVGVIGYGKGLKAGLGGKLPHDILIPISKLSDHPLRIENRKRSRNRSRRRSSITIGNRRVCSPSNRRGTTSTRVQSFFNELNTSPVSSFG